jgi:hypothetical protein
MAAAVKVLPGSIAAQQQVEGGGAVRLTQRRALTAFRGGW